MIIEFDNSFIISKPWWVSHRYRLKNGEVIVARAETHQGWRDLTIDDLQSLKKNEKYELLAEPSYEKSIEYTQCPATNNDQNIVTIEKVKQILDELENEGIY